MEIGYRYCEIQEEGHTVAEVLLTMTAALYSLEITPELFMAVMYQSIPLVRWAVLL
ncbi:hypothetical protein FACS189443_0640 [Planctomycetales bacterium]|nr:hypothetical protein FACS189443_0640 [Planctomycetales bacterium]